MATILRDAIVQPKKIPRRPHWREGEIQSSSLALLTTVQYSPFANSDSSSVVAFGRIKAEVYSSPLVLLTSQAAATIVFRKTLSGIGGRVGSRQIQGH